MNEEALLKTKNLIFKPITLKMNEGKLKIGENNVIHPMVYLFSDGGDIVIGNLNIFEEKVIIYNKSKTSTLVIGDCNFFKIGTKIYSSSIENYNDFGINSYIDQSKIGSCNIFGCETRLRLSTTVWEKKSFCQNGNLSDNLLYDGAARKEYISTIIVRTNEIVKKNMAKRTEIKKP